MGKANSPKLGKNVTNRREILGLHYQQKNRTRCRMTKLVTRPKILSTQNKRVNHEYGNHRTFACHKSDRQVIVYPSFRGLCVNLCFELKIYMQHCVPKYNCTVFEYCVM